MSLKSLVIRSTDTPPAKEFTWESIQNMNNFIKNIQTQSIGDDESEDLSKLGSVISGMPTVFARSNMFFVAVKNIQDKNQVNTGLMAFYSSLISEWRGLITCIALNPDKIQIKRINLSYADGQNISSVSQGNLYEPKGSFGNMLFERAPLWSNPNDDAPKPFLDVILFKKSDGSNMVIGGTNPDSLFFTSANYNMSGEKSAYVKIIKSDNKEKGVFTDPIKQKSFDIQSVHKLHSYVVHVRSKMNAFTNFFASKDIIERDYHNDVITNFDNWIKEMEAFIKEKGISFENPEIPQISHFQTPYSIFGNYSTNIAALDGEIYDGGVDGGVTFNPKELLLPNTTKIACVDDEGNKDFLKDKPLLLLKADVEGEPNEVRHFMLPLSPKGIRVFGRNLGAVLGLNDNTSVKSRMKAIYNTNGTLSVVITLISQTKKIGEIKEEYKTTKDDISGKDLLIWPNFISPKWNKYFLFSEMPHNSPNWQAVPFCVDIASDRQEMIMSLSDPEVPEFLANKGEETDASKAKLIIDFNPKKLSGNKYHYEIYESKNPFKGFQLLHQNNLVGYAVIEYGTDPKSPISDFSSSMGDLRPAHLGVDFGSTNSAIAYRDGDNGDAVGFQFTNRRVSLLAPGGDDKNNKTKPAGEDEVFFFQNDEIQSNQIKSVLALHDSNRMKDDKGQANLTSLASEYVKGGFPCFEKNLPIEDSTKHSYSLKFRSIGQATLIHNMKWNSDSSSKEIDNAYRKAYLKSLLLQVYSDLFDKGLYASTLKWAYPSAMGDNLIGDYNAIWQELKEVNPIKGGDHELTVMIGAGNFDIEGGGAGAWGVGSSASETSDDGWGSSTSAAPAADAWGASPEPQQAAPQSGSGGWGEEKPKIQKQKEITLDDSAITFDFQEIDNKKAMTESCAVANYLAESLKISTDPDALTLCFDIGGSTTDILVLGQMMGPNRQALSMVKQSSIRFAAQRVAQATKYSPNFKSVLIDTLTKKGIKLEGINNGGANKYNENTAPYYFEQLVDRLEENEFDDFYRALGTQCKEMVAVNTYVTGLIVFYAGQVAKKVKMEIDRSPNKTSQWKNPRIQLQFTGKGSRIMDWLKAINPAYDKKYYMDMFINGFGGMEEAKKHLGAAPQFQLRNDLQDVKYEVAKGLVSNSTALYVPKTGQKPLEVIGEEGFTLFSGGEERKLSSDDSITPELMEEIGKSFAFRPADPNRPCPRFMEFAHLYFQVATQLFELKATQQDFINGFQRMNISDYIKLLPEFKESQRNEKGFDFVAPIIILEGMQFFENVILKNISNK